MKIAMNFNFIKYLLFIFLGFMQACKTKADLPIIGEKDTDANGKEVAHTIGDWQLINQDGDTLSQKDLKGKVYVADFFFTSCPTICPVMKTQMLRVHEHFKNNDKVGIISHSIDPRHDSVAVLKAYKQKMGVTGSQWQFLTGDQDYIHSLAVKRYLVAAMEDEKAVSDGGFTHSGAFVLVDTEGHIRGLYDGTIEKEVDKLIKDIEILLAD
jgi:protein SCO1